MNNRDSKTASISSLIKIKNYSSFCLLNSFHILMYSYSISTQ